MTDAALPIRVLHFADVHIGMENYGRTDPQFGLSSRVVDFLRRMEGMIDDARTHGVDLVVFAGDAFKTRTPSPTFQREFAYRVRDLSQLAPVVLLVGNHDLAPHIYKASSLEIYAALEVPNVWVADEYAVRVIDTARGPVAVGAAPYPTREALMSGARVSGQTIQQADDMLRRRLADELERLAATAHTHRDIPRLLTGHFMVGGALAGSERNLMLGSDIPVPLGALADPRWDYVALGHIHKHQNLTAGRDDVPPVIYAGSLERIDFGEEADPKGYVWVDLARHNTAWRFVQVPARRMVTIRQDMRAVEQPTTALIEHIRAIDVADAVVRVFVQLTVDNEPKFNDAAVRAALAETGAFYAAQVKKEVMQVQRARLGEAAETLSEEELLARYLAHKGHTPTAQERLLALARDLFEATPEADTDR